MLGTPDSGHRTQQEIRTKSTIPLSREVLTTGSILLPRPRLRTLKTEDTVLRTRGSEHVEKNWLVGHKSVLDGGVSCLRLSDVHPIQTHIYMPWNNIFVNFCVVVFEWVELFCRLDFEMMIHLRKNWMRRPNPLQVNATSVWLSSDRNRNNTNLMQQCNATADF